MTNDATRQPEASARTGSSDLDLVERLQLLSLTFETRHRIGCSLDVSREHLRTDPLVGDVLARTVEELLANVGRHAKASRVEITSASRDDGSTVLLVKDDGVGFDFSAPGMVPSESGRGGLLVADKRLREIGAYLEITSESGTCITIVLPGRQVIVD